MRKNYTPFFVILSVASLSGGLGLSKYFEHAMMVGIFLNIIFLICAGYALGKYRTSSEAR